MDYVLVRAPPLQPGLPRPRLSFYLSFQLQYGVIIVYHRQCVLLLEEIQHTIDRLLRSTKLLKIDLVELVRPGLTVPDGLSLLEEFERAQDPFFGVMEYAMLSPSAVIQWQAAEGTSPQRPLVERLGTPKRDRITASPESITLVEREPTVSPAAEFEGAELQEVTPRYMGMVDILMEQQDQFPEEVEEREEVRKAERATEQHQQQQALADSALSLGVTASIAEELALLPEKAAGSPGAATPSTPTLLEGVALLRLPPEGEKEERQTRREIGTEDPSLELEPVAPPKKPRRRRQLLFIDNQTQIPSAELQEAIQDPLTETRTLESFEPPSKRRVSPEELLSNPCAALHLDILDLWGRAAVVTPLSRKVAARESMEEEGESERGSLVAEEQVREADEREKEESKEVARELVESGRTQIEASVSTDLSEASHWEESHRTMPEGRGSPTGDSPLKDIQEEEARPAEGELPQVVVSRENLIGILQEHAEVSFHSLLPPLADRSTVSCSFSALLVFASTRLLRVEQEESYGTIMIAKGPQYEQEGDQVPHAD